MKIDRLKLLMIVVVVGLVGIGFVAYHQTPNKSSSSSSSSGSTQLAKTASKQTAELSVLNKQLASTSSPAVAAQFTETAKARFDTMQKLLDQEQVKTVLALAKPGHFTNAPTSAIPYLETSARLEGKLTVIHGENFDKQGNPIEGTENHEYWVGPSYLKGKRLYLADDAPDQFTNAQIAADVTQFGTVFAADNNSLTVTAAAPAMTPPAQMKIAVVLMHDPKSPGKEDYTPAQVKANFFGPRPDPYGVLPDVSVAAFMNAASDGQTTVSGDVFGWWDGYSGSCDLSLSQVSEAKTLMLAHGINPDTYTHIVAVSATQPTGNGCYSGVGAVGSPGVFLNGMANSTAQPKHELGHNLGNWHAGEIYPQTQTQCSAAAYQTWLPPYGCLIEYADQTDVMGSGGGSHEYSAYHKYVIGWLPPSSVQTVMTGTQTVTLTPSETPLSGGIKLLFVGKYTVEFRAPTSFDAASANGGNAVSGVYLHQVSPGSTVAGTADTAMPRMPDGADKPLAIGQTYTDGNISIKTLSTGTSTAQVQVTINTPPPPVCNVADPMVSISPVTKQTVLAGASASYTISVTNNDAGNGCGAVSFNLGAASSDPVITQTVSAGSLSLGPGATGTITATVKSTTAAIPKDYNVAETISSSGHNSANVMALYSVLDNKLPTTPTGLKVDTTKTTANTIGLSWTASTDNSGVIAGYNVFQGTVKVGTSATTSYLASGLSPSTTYSFKVSAYDPTGNTSALSAAVNGTTIAGTTGKPGDLNSDGVVDNKDRDILLGNFPKTSNATPLQGDLNGDKIINIFDLSRFLSDFGK